MASELLNSLSNACRTHGHIIYNQNLNDGHGGFERAGKRHAIATFFGASSAKAKNEATLAAIKNVLAAERNTDFGSVMPGDLKSYFSGIKSSGRIKSATVSRIIDNIKNDISSALAKEMTRLFGPQFEGYRPPEKAVVPGNDYTRNALNGIIAMFDEVSVENAGDFAAVMADILRHDVSVGASPEHVASCARTVNEALRFLHGQSSVHPGALEDGVRLMKDLHAPVDARAMERFLGMAKGVVDGMYGGAPLVESLDENLTSICSAGRDVQSCVETEKKNWIVAKFILASIPKVNFEPSTNRIGEVAFQQQVCGGMLLSPTVRDLRAFYDRVEDPVCAQCSKAIEFLVDRYWNAGVAVGARTGAVNANTVPEALKEKYGVGTRTVVRPDGCRTEPGDYEELSGRWAPQANAAASLIDGVLGRYRILGDDKAMVKQMALQYVAFACKASGGFLGRDAIVRMTNRYCRMAMWGGALLDRLAKEVPVNYHKAVILSMEAYDCSSDGRLFDMITKDRGVLNGVKEYIDDCSDKDGKCNAPEGTSVDVVQLHEILTGKPGFKDILDSRVNPHLATFYSWASGE